MLKLCTSFPLGAVVAVAATCCFASLAEAATIPATRSSDNVIQGNFEAGDPDVYLTDNSNARRVGTGGASAATRVNQPILGFSLPAIPADDIVVGAEFSFTMDSPAFNEMPLTFDVVVSLMGGATQASFSASDFVEVPGPAGLGAGNSFVGTLAEGDTGDGEVETFALTGDALTQLAALYDLSGAPSQAEVFFRLSTSNSIDTNGVNNSLRFNLARNDSGSGNLVTRTLTLETRPIPEPSSLALIGMTGIALAVRSRRRSLEA